MRFAGLLGLAVLLAAASMGAQKGAAPNLIVHEWGTFLTMAGSNGLTLDGMYHEEHALPAFVHARSRDQLRLHSAMVKGETPVIYFYTQRPQQVNVRVDFPGGLWTQWYPQASLVGPGLAASSSPPGLRDGHIEWNAQLTPVKESGNPSLPAAGKDSLWKFARQVDAALVSTNKGGGWRSDTSEMESERFLFYRGLGTAELPLEVSAENNGTLSLSAGAADSVRHLFVVRVENGRGAYRYIESLKSGESLSNVIPSLSDAKPVAEFAANIADDLASRLTESGLFEKESRAMVNTWKSSYFESDGVRVLYVLPQMWTDRYIPMKVEPRPDKLVRVMVGRTELLTPEREKRVETAVRELGSKEGKLREKSYEFLRDQGRYVEPILRRVRGTTADPVVRKLCGRLLAADFVNELRTASRSASDGSKVVEEPVYLRAQLAALLREVGLADEGKAESKAALAELDRMHKPKETESGARHHLRAYARAMEGAADDAGAVEWYGKFIRFGSQSKTCSHCHHEEGPRNMAWYRDWWAGRRYAEAVRRSGAGARTVRQHQQVLERRPGETATQMMLGYLLEQRGAKAEADAQWAMIEGRALAQRP